MNPDMKNLRDELLWIAGQEVLKTSIRVAAERAANFIQAIFDPENQPSQYGTTLVSD